VAGGEGEGVDDVLVAWLVEVGDDEVVEVGDEGGEEGGVVGLGGEGV